jgi:uncharacterized protein YbcV (DUF1398 family)
MSKAIENLQTAQKKAIEMRPKVGGFPYLAEILRQAGVKKNLWILPSLQSIYLTELGSVVNQGTPLVNGMSDIAPFNKDNVIKAIRTDQDGKSTFPEFLISIWKAGVVQYEADFITRKVTYFGSNNETYEEVYPEVKLQKI